MPSQPGDSAAAIRFRNPGFPEIPVSLRTLIPTGPNGGSFTGTLTGGNGNHGAPTQTYSFDVPHGVNNMSLVLELAESGYSLTGLLVDPNGMQLSVELNVDQSGNLQNVLQQFRANPQPGRWRFLLQYDLSSGNRTSVPFTARIGFNTAQIMASLPNSSGVTLSAGGGSVTVPITVTNTGAVTEAYFADARLRALAWTPLSVAGSPTGTLPGFGSAFILPPEVDSIQFVAQSSVPITMDAYYANFSAPDIYARKVAPDTVVASLNVPEVPFGLWFVFPALIGPFGATGAPTTPIGTAAFALMQPFDPAVSADSGDIWADLTLDTNTYNPLVLAPGQSGTINLVITPSAPVGSIVSGYIYVDTFEFVGMGDEVVRIPYSYTVAP